MIENEYFVKIFNDVINNIISFLLKYIIVLFY